MCLIIHRHGPTNFIACIGGGEIELFEVGFYSFCFPNSISKSSHGVSIFV